MVNLEATDTELRKIRSLEWLKSNHVTRTQKEGEWRMFGFMDGTYSPYVRFLGLRDDGRMVFRVVKDPFE